MRVRYDANVRIEGCPVIVEQRTYTLKPGMTAAYLSLYRRRGYDVQLQHLGRLIGYYTTEVGPLNRLIHLWAYDDMADRAARRSRLFADERWSAVVVELYGMIDRMENTILAPTDFSPVR